jgi:hypothetical protein
LQKLVYHSMKMKKYFLSVSLVLAFALLPSLLFAQLDPGPPGCDPDQECPMDSGTIFLIISAIAIAFFKFAHTKLRIAK